MINNPQIGALYWVIDEFWSQAAVVPVKLTEINADYGDDGGVWRGVWELGADYTEEYEFLQLKDLYATEDEAWAQVRLEAAQELEVQ